MATTIQQLEAIRTKLTKANQLEPYIVHLIGKGVYFYASDEVFYAGKTDYNFGGPLLLFVPTNSKQDGQIADSDYANETYYRISNRFGNRLERVTQ